MKTAHKTDLNGLRKERALRRLPLSVIILNGILGFGMVLSAGRALAQSGHEKIQKIRYDVYAGGVHALQADLDLDLSKSENYSAVLSAKTYGLLGKLAPWQGVFESHGWHGNPNKPKIHKSITTWKDEDEIKEYHYNKDGTFGAYKITDPDNDGKPQTVAAELTDGTTDVLSATLNTMQGIAQGEPCTGTTEIFDGKRRYKMIFNHKQDVTLEKNRWNAYAGPAVECTIEVQPVAGAWHSKPRGWLSIQEQGRERGTMPTVWFASLADGKPAVPVKLRVKTAYGTLFMHMTEYESGSKQLALKD